MRRPAKHSKKNNFSPLYVVLLLILCISIMPVNFGIAMEGTGDESAVTADSGDSVEKEEVVYANLSSSGAIDNIYVVNAFTLDTDDTIEDYGDYNAVKNLTNTDEITYTDGRASVAAEKGRFYYQGMMNNKALPWNISIHYYLDDVEKTAEEMSGASGRARITVETAKAPDADPVYYDNYMLQVSVKLDSEICSDIFAEGATIANAGKDKAVNFTAMPGQDSFMEVSADVTDFGMDGISIAGVPFSISGNIVDTSTINRLTSGLQELADGVAQLDSGAGELNGGFTAFKQGTDDLEKGFTAFNSGISQISPGLQEISGGAASLKEGSAQFKAGLGEISATGTELAAGSEAFNTALAGLNENPVIQADPALKAAISQLVTQYAGLNAGLTQYAGGVSALNDNYAGIDAGITGLSDGIAQLSGGIQSAAAGSGQMLEGIKGINAGAGELAGGMNELTAGIHQLNSETSVMPARIQQEIDDLLGRFDRSDFKPVSFTSAENGNIEAVQFVFAAEGIEKPEKPAPEKIEKDSTSLFEKFLDLFR